MARSAASLSSTTYQLVMRKNRDPKAYTERAERVRGQ
jgi:hypothetical protein